MPTVMTRAAGTRLQPRQAAMQGQCAISRCRRAWRPAARCLCANWCRLLQLELAAPSLVAVGLHVGEWNPWTRPLFAAVLRAPLLLQQRAHPAIEQPRR